MADETAEVGADDREEAGVLPSKRLNDRGHRRQRGQSGVRVDSYFLGSESQHVSSYLGGNAHPVPGVGEGV